MIVPYYSYNGVFILLNAIWIFGISLFIWKLSWSISDIKNVSKQYKHRFLKNKAVAFLWIFIVVICIVAMPDNTKVTKEKFRFIDDSDYLEEKCIIIKNENQIAFTNADLEMRLKNDETSSAKYPYDDSTVVMPWNGYIGTPSMDMEKGQYILDFRAKGTIAENKPARIHVFLIAMKDEKTVLEKLYESIILEEQERLYEYRFILKNNLLRKIRIQFINDGGDLRGGDRNVYISNIKIRRMREEKGDS